jgi:signal transduction histidine kinase
MEKHRHLLEGKAVEVKLDISSRPCLTADRPLLLIVVGNLIRNAFQNTDRGEVSIRLTQERLCIADTGHGIAEAELASIFQRHYKGSKSRGEGIGLSLTKRICDRYGWTIKMASFPGSGTEVHLGFNMETDPSI